MGEVLRLLAHRQQDRMMGDPGPLEPCLQGGKMKASDRPIGDDDRAMLREWANMPSGIADKAGSDEDIVATATQFDPQSTVAAHGRGLTKRRAGAPARS